MKICIISRLHSLGGAQRSLASFIQAASKTKKFHLELLTGSQIHPYMQNQILSSGVPIHYFARFHKIPVPKYPPQIRRWYLTKLIHKVNPDVLIMWEYSNDYRTAIAARKIGSKVLYFERGAAWGHKNRESRKRTFENIDGILCNSMAAKRVLKLKWELRQPIVVCRNALRPEMQPETVQAKKFPSNRGIRLGVAGRLEKGKGIGLAIRTCVILRHSGYDASLHIAGTGTMQAELENLSRDLGIYDHCVFLGSIKDMTRFYQQMDICIVPSIHESFGLVSIEAQAWGCATIVAGVDGLAETVLDNQTGSIIKPTLPLDHFPDTNGLPGQSVRFYYDSTEDAVKPLGILDPEDISIAVKKIIDQPSRFEAMSQAASKRILSEFTFDENTNNIIESIRSLSS